jgi:hypothetical protein
MAAALRKVTENYDWTLKRADNDLHNVITQTPSPPTPPSRPDIKPVDPSGASTWDVGVCSTVCEGGGHLLNIYRQITFDGNSGQNTKNFASILAVPSSFYSVG